MSRIGAALTLLMVRGILTPLDKASLKLFKSKYHEWCNLTQDLLTRFSFMENDPIDVEILNLKWFLQALIFKQLLLRFKTSSPPVNKQESSLQSEFLIHSKAWDLLLLFNPLDKKGLTFRISEKILTKLLLLNDPELRVLTKLKVPHGMKEMLENITDELAASIPDLRLFNQILGNIHQSLLTMPTRKQRGVYYTPKEIINFITSETLRHYIFSELKRNGVMRTTKTLDKFIMIADEKELTLLFSILRDLTILDPSMGAGDFLLASLKELSRTWEQLLVKASSSHFKAIEASLRLVLNGKKQSLLPIFKENPKKTLFLIQIHQIMQRNIHGVDSDEIAVRLAQARLLLEALSSTDFFDASVLADLDLSTNLKQGNSLIGFIRAPSILKKKDKEHFQTITEHERKKQLDRSYLESLGINKQKSVEDTERPDLSQIKCFHWFLEFPEVFQKWDGFSIILGNPPYLKNKYMPNKTILERIYPIYAGDCDVYTLFYYRGYLLLNSKGYLTFISKNRWWHGSTYQPFITEFLLKFKTLYLVFDFEDHSLFKNVGVTCNILFLTKEQSSSIIWYRLIDSRKVFPIGNEQGYEKTIISDLLKITMEDQIIQTMKKNSLFLQDLKKMKIIDYGKGPSPVPNKCFIFELVKIGKEEYLVNEHIQLKFTPSIRKFFFRLVTAGQLNSPEMHVNDLPRYLLYLDEYQSESEIEKADKAFYDQIRILRSCIEKRKSSKDWFRYDTSRNPHLLKASRKICSAKMRQNTFRYYDEPVVFTSGVSAIILSRSHQQLRDLIELLPLLNSLLMRYYLFHPASKIKLDKYRLGLDTSDNLGKIPIPKALPHEDLSHLGQIYREAFQLTLNLTNTQATLMKNDNLIFLKIKKNLNVLFFLIELTIIEIYLSPRNVLARQKPKHLSKDVTNKKMIHFPLTKSTVKMLREQNVLEQLRKLNDTNIDLSNTLMLKKMKKGLKLEIHPQLKEMLRVFIESNKIFSQVLKKFIEKRWIDSFLVNELIDHALKECNN